MPNIFTAACIQNNASNDMEKTLKTAEKLFRDAASSGADLITLPEFFSCLSIEKSGLNTNPHTEDERCIKPSAMLVWTNRHFQPATKHKRGPNEPPLR